MKYTLTKIVKTVLRNDNISTYDEVVEILNAFAGTGIAVDLSIEDLKLGIVRKKTGVKIISVNQEKKKINVTLEHRMGIMDTSLDIESIVELEATTEKKQIKVNEEANLYDFLDI